MRSAIAHQLNRAATKQSSSFKGNKQSLPGKPCAACGRVMTWRKRWERNWTEVKFCSDACRKSRGLEGGA